MHSPVPYLTSAPAAQRDVAASELEVSVVDNGGNS